MSQRSYIIMDFLEMQVLFCKIINKHSGHLSCKKSRLFAFQTLSFKLQTDGIFPYILLMPSVNKKAHTPCP